MNTPTRRLDQLYADAFARFGTACLWSKKPVPHPTVQHARIIADALRIEGGRDAYVLAREIDEACNAVDRSAA